MKCHLAVAVFAVCAVAAFGTKITDEECAKKFSSASSVLDKVKKGEEVKIDDKRNCLYACVLKKAKIMKADGTIDKEVFRSKIPASVEKPTVDLIMSCLDSTGKDECEATGKIIDCLRDKKGVSYLAN